MRANFQSLNNKKHFCIKCKIMVLQTILVFRTAWKSIMLLCLSFFCVWKTVINTVILILLSYTDQLKPKTNLWKVVSGSLFLWKNFEHEMHFDLLVFFFHFHFKSFRRLFMFQPHTRQPQMCFILELWRSLNPIIQSKMEWIGELSTNMKWKKYFRGKPMMTFFSKFIQKRPKCHNPTYMQGRGLWIWALGSGRLSSRAAWAGSHHLGGRENFISVLPLLCHQNAPAMANMVIRKAQ